MRNTSARRARMICLVSHTPVCRRRSYTVTRYDGLLCAVTDAAGDQPFLRRRTGAGRRDIDVVRTVAFRRHDRSRANVHGTAARRGNHALHGECIYVAGTLARRGFAAALLEQRILAFHILARTTAALCLQRLSADGSVELP